LNSEYDIGLTDQLFESKKVFVFTESDGTIPHSEDNGEYYFQVDEVIDLKELVKS
jgi:hypothetical protein